jgi:hypothetical protein
MICWRSIVSYAQLRYVGLLGPAIAFQITARLNIDPLISKLGQKPMRSAGLDIGSEAPEIALAIVSGAAVLSDRCGGFLRERRVIFTQPSLQQAGQPPSSSLHS